ncbi:hypothetical protein B0T26DRAFT_699533 [Lasiosphaeria miniovina]|uniref:Uncharacterized protein n=1 Tax=Lasiosphaeria miniovina TaxID=1954250 RepID=A0AA40B718_9PEZI|nr:uncharacterized protein B0T26DRAFT_699533 [Lasiosphaeria miniovina]KAK0728864.1 hypothetical protein B0T26DRAFT_699533 [Lasiosphaeria miniovina]
MDVALRLVGAATLATLGYKALDAASLWLLPAVSLSRYQHRDANGRPCSWALVTGASAGIGLGCALELACRGFNVIILGHKPSELAEAEAAILAEAPSVEVRVVVLDAVRATAADIDAALDSVADLGLAVLVNNIGGIVVQDTRRTLRTLDEFTAQDVDNTISLSARFMAQVTRRLIPTLRQHSVGARSLIINLSSAAHLGLPQLGPYSSCKGFVNAMTASLARDFRTAGVGVDAIAIIPGDVRSQSNDIAPPSAPDSRQYAKAIMERVGRAVDKDWLTLSPWWPHAAQIWMLRVALPEWLARKALSDEFAKKKQQEALKHANKDD